MVDLPGHFWAKVKFDITYLFLHTVSYWWSIHLACLSSPNMLLRVISSAHNVQYKSCSVILIKVLGGVNLIALDISTHCILIVFMTSQLSRHQDCKTSHQINQR